MPLSRSVCNVRGLIRNCWQTSWLSIQRPGLLSSLLLRISFTLSEKRLNFPTISSNTFFSMTTKLIRVVFNVDNLFCPQSKTVVPTVQRMRSEVAASGTFLSPLQAFRGHGTVFTPQRKDTGSTVQSLCIPVAVFCFGMVAIGVFQSLISVLSLPVSISPRTSSHMRPDLM